MTDTYVANVGGEELVFLFGAAGDPVTYASNCSINTDSKLDLSADIYSGTRANCTDPSKPSKVTRRVKSVDVKFTGSGMADGPSAKALVTAFLAGVPILGKVVQDGGTGGAGFTITGTWVIESTSLGGAHREDQPFDIAIATTGDFVLS